MMPEKTKIKKSDVINGAIKMLAILYDVDWYPDFKNKRDIKRVIEWMNLYKMQNKHKKIFFVAFSLTCQSKKTQPHNWGL